MGGMVQLRRSSAAIMVILFMTLPDSPSDPPSERSWDLLASTLLLLLPLMFVFTYKAGFVLIPLIACLLVACTPPAALNWLPHIALLTLALISGLAWCSEVESQLGAGWDQLTIEYRSRRVVPGSFAAFIIWALGVVRVQRPSAFIALLAGYAGFVILGIEGLWQLQLWLNRQDSSQTRGYIPFCLDSPPCSFFGRWCPWDSVPSAASLACT
jgi:hypothetical protein